jgi:hypothetical protein
MTNCWPWNHQWTKWRTLEVGELQNREKLVFGHYECQRRECEKCGKVERREVYS